MIDGISESDGKVLHEGRCNGTHQSVIEGISQSDGKVLGKGNFNGTNHAIKEDGIRNGYGESCLDKDGDICNGFGYNHRNDDVLSGNRIRKLSLKEMKVIMIEYYMCKGDIRLWPFVKHKVCHKNKNAIYRHWRESGLKEMKKASTPIKDAMTLYDVWVNDAKTRASEQYKNNGSSDKVFPTELEQFMHGLIKQMALCGQGIGKKVLTELFEQSLQDWNKENNRTFC